jgi:2-O-methyltransferase
MGHKGDIIFPIVRKSKVIVDLGANNGREAKRFLKLSPQAEMHIFEPLPRWFRYLSKKFGSKSNCYVYDIAISDKDGMADFYPEPPGGKQNSSSLRGKTTKLHDVVFKDSIKVKTQRLDTWYRQTDASTVDFIWSDIEGSERELINGGMETLKNTRYFYTEYTEKTYLEGQALLPEIVDLISPYFDIVEKFPWFNDKKNKSWHFGNILFKNKKINYE